MSIGGGANVGTATGYLKLDISGFKASIEESKKELNGGLDEMETSSGKKGNGIAKQFDNMGKAMLKGVTVPVAGATTACVKFAGDFESAMVKTSAISGATGKDLQKLSDNAKAVGNDLSISASDAAGAYEYMAMAGWDTNDMLAGLKPIMQLSIATGTDLASTSDIVTDALTAFGLSADDTSDFCDLLAKTSVSANTDVLKLGESFKYVAPVAGSLGYTSQDTAFALGLMANSGIKAGQAGTSLRAALAHLEKPSKTVAEMMDKYGISLTTADGKMKPLKQLTDELRVKLGGLSEAERTTAIATLFGTEAQAGMSAIINASDEDYDKLYKNLGDCKDASGNMAKTMRDSLTGQLNAAKANVHNLAITFGEDLLPTAKKILEYINKLITAFQGTPKPVRNVIEVVALLAAGLPVAITAVKGLASAFTFLAANPVGAIVTAVGLVVTAVVTLWNTNEDFRKAVIKLWNNIKEKIDEACESLKKTYDEVVKNLGKAWADMKSDAKKAIDDIVEKYESVKKSISDLMKSIADSVSGKVADVVQGFTDMKDKAIKKINEFKDKVEEIVEKIKGFFDFSKLKDNVEQQFKEIKDKFSLKGAWNNLRDEFTDIKDKIKDKLTGNSGSVLSTTESAFDSIKKKFSLTGAWRGIWDGLTEVRDKLWDRLGSWNNTTSVYSYVKTGIENIKKKFDVTLPKFKIPLPHISITGSFSLMPPSTPSISVKWYKTAMQNPTLLDGATLFGAMGSKMLGGGEAGRELVVGERKFIDSIKAAMREILKEDDSFTVEAAKTISSGLQSVTRAIDNLRDTTPKRQASGGDTFIFNSPKAIDEVEAARQLQKVKEQLVIV